MTDPRTREHAITLHFVHNYTGHVNSHAEARRRIQEIDELFRAIGGEPSGLTPIEEVDLNKVPFPKIEMEK